MATSPTIVGPTTMPHDTSNYIFHVTMTEGRYQGVTLFLSLPPGTALCHLAMMLDQMSYLEPPSSLPHISHLESFHMDLLVPTGILGPMQTTPLKGDFTDDDNDATSTVIGDFYFLSSNGFTIQVALDLYVEGDMLNKENPPCYEAGHWLETWVYQARYLGRATAAGSGKVVCLGLDVNGVAADMRWFNIKDINKELSDPWWVNE